MWDFSPLLATTISSLNCESFNYLCSPSSGSFFFIDTLASLLMQATLNEKTLTTSVMKTFDTRSWLNLCRTISSYTIVGSMRGAWGIINIELKATPSVPKYKSF
jgi:hypothetical protein